MGRSPWGRHVPLSTLRYTVGFWKTLPSSYQEVKLHMHSDIKVCRYGGHCRHCSIHVWCYREYHDVRSIVKLFKDYQKMVEHFDNLPVDISSALSRCLSIILNGVKYS